MADTVKIIIDGKAVQAQAGQTILEAASDAGIYIPHLCYHKDLTPGGHCRVCTVKVNGKPINACTMIVGQGMVVESDTEELNEMRKNIIEMLFVEGNHICPACEKSGNCELQALAYRFQMLVPGYPYLFPKKELDGQHPDWVGYTVAQDWIHLRAIKTRSRAYPRELELKIQSVGARLRMDENGRVQSYAIDFPARTNPGPNRYHH